MTFELTESKVLLNVWLSAGAAGLSIVLCSFVLLITLWVYSKRQARHIIDRVSFRLLLWSMLFEIIYDIAYIAVEVESAAPLTPNDLCASGVYWMIATLGVVNFLCTCIALNLMLTICFGVNTIKRRLERLYVGFSVGLGMGIPIVPAALDHFGWDPILNVCWIKARDDKTRMKYFILDLYLWQSISCLIASFAVVMVLRKLLRQSLRTTKAMTTRMNTEPLQLELRKASATNLGHLEDQFLKIALRISTYPVALIIVNGVITVGDLYISKAGGVYSNAVYGLYCIYYFLYGGRGIVFAALGIFVDPCLWRGMKAAWNTSYARTNIPVRNGTPFEPKSELVKQSLFEILTEDTPVLGSPLLGLGTQSPVMGEAGQKLEVKIGVPTGKTSASIELFQALNHLPYEARSSVQLQQSQRESLDISSFTKSFNGVPSGSLPAGLTDDVDVDLRPASNQRSVRVLSPRVDLRRTMLDVEEGVVVNEHRLEPLEPLQPDLPDPDEERRRRRRAERVAREEAFRLFEETQAQL